MFKRKKQQLERLRASFGKLKNDGFDFDEIETYFRNKDSNGAYQVISDKTFGDLDFESVFMFLDRTSSKIGQQYLYYKLRTIAPNTKKTLNREQVIENLTKNESLRIKVQKLLEQLTGYDAYRVCDLFQQEHPKTPKWFVLIKSLSAVSLVSLMLCFFSPKFFLLFAALFAINLVIHIWNKQQTFVLVNSIPQVLKLHTVAAYLYQIETLQSLGVAIPAALNTVGRVKRRMIFLKLETKLQGEFEAVAWFFLELFKIAFLLEPLLFFNVLHTLDSKRAQVEDLYQFVGEVDMAVSIASLREGLAQFCIPDITNDTGSIHAKGAYHPLITDCVANTISIDNKSVLLTGSNMAGKTSFIRTIGINVIVGLNLNTCFAAGMQFPLLRVFSALRISDDLLSDKSYYFEEVLTIKAMLEQSEMEQPSLFLLDEIFKGTNTIERIAGGKAVLSALSRNNNRVVVATHDIELADMLSDQFDLFHFSETVDGFGVVFDYQLKKGKLTKRNAIRILELNKYPQHIVAEAMAIAKRLDTNSSASN